MLIADGEVADDSKLQVRVREPDSRSGPPAWAAPLPMRRRRRRMQIMPAVIESLRQEHHNIARLLGALEHQIDVFAGEGAPDYDVVRGIADFFMEYPDRCHHPKEDLVFSRLRERHQQEASTVADLLGEHRLAHDEALQFQHTISALLNDTDIARSAIVGAARTFIGDQRRHMQGEEDRFFPLAEELLTAEDWSAIEASLMARADPRGAEARFNALADQLIAWEREYPA